MCKKWNQSGLVPDLFGKAKKKILKQDDLPEMFSNAIPQDKRQSPEINWGPQEIGRQLNLVFKIKKKIHSEIICSNNKYDSWNIITDLKSILGATASHTRYFKDIRNARLERYAYETNKLLIRLDKLLNNLPSDPVDRKGEKMIIN